MTQNSRDLCVRRTHKLLREAMVALIEEQRFDSITVEAIAERAMVSRAEITIVVRDDGNGKTVEFVPWQDGMK